MRPSCNASSLSLRLISKLFPCPDRVPWVLTAASRQAAEMSKLNETDIQGFVLRGYNLPVARYLLLRFEAASRARKLIGRLLSKVTTGQHWDGGKPPSTMNVA